METYFCARGTGTNSKVSTSIVKICIVGTTHCPSNRCTIVITAVDAHVNKVIAVIAYVVCCYKITGCIGTTVDVLIYYLCKVIDIFYGLYTSIVKHKSIECSAKESCAIGKHVATQVNISGDYVFGFKSSVCVSGPVVTVGATHIVF